MRFPVSESKLVDTIERYMAGAIEAADKKWKAEMRKKHKNLK